MTASIINTIFQQRRDTPSDINEHFDTLKKYASQCRHVTEMGVCEVNSTWAFLAGQPQKYVGYDCYPRPVEQAMSAAAMAGIEFEFYVRDTSDPALVIEPTDLLFIDTYHVYDHLRKELSLHAARARKYIILHDTTTFEWTGDVTEYPSDTPPEDRSQPRGLWPAIAEFLEQHPEWTILERFTNNNGLTVLARQ